MTASSLTRTAISTATSGIKYNSDGSIGWSNDQFKAGIKSGAVNFALGSAGQNSDFLKNNGWARSGMTSFTNNKLDFNEGGWKVGIRDDNNWGDRFAGAAASASAAYATEKLTNMMKEPSVNTNTPGAQSNGADRKTYTGGITTQEYASHLISNTVNAGIMSAYNMARYDMSWSQASTTTGFYSGTGYSASDLGGFTGSLAMGHMAYLANKKNTQIATDAALKEMGHETDSEGNPLGKDPLSKVENFLVGMYESICGSFSRIKGLGESVGNLVGGKGFNTDAELTEQSKQLVDEYNRIKDMTLLAGVGDANMKSAAEAAARKAEIENELAKKDPDALAKLQAESPEGKAKAAGLKTAVDAAMKYYDGYDKAVKVALAEFEKDMGKDQNVTGGVTIARDKYGRITSVTDNSLDMTQAVINKFDKNNNTLNTIEQTYNMNGGKRGTLASEMIFQDNDKVVLKYGDSGKITGWEFYKKSEHADFYEAVDVNQKFIDAMKSKVGTEYTWGGGNMTAYRGYSNLKADGTWRGYDCCGSVVESMRNALDMNMKQFNGFNVTGLYNADFMENTTTDENGNVVFVHYNGVTADPGHVMVYNEWTDENGKKYDIMSTHGVVIEKIKTVPILGKVTYYEDVLNGDTRFGADNAGLLSVKDTKAWWSDYAVKQSGNLSAGVSMKKINWGEVYKKYKLK